MLLSGHLCDSLSCFGESICNGYSFASVLAGE